MRDYIAAFGFAVLWTALSAAAAAVILGALGSGLYLIFR